MDNRFSVKASFVGPRRYDILSRVSVGEVCTQRSRGLRVYRSRKVNQRRKQTRAFRSRRRQVNGSEVDLFSPLAIILGCSRNLPRCRVAPYRMLEILLNPAVDG